jgi:tripartite-type tricarboxylate transporter receptor subunit TctC
MTQRDAKLTTKIMTVSLGLLCVSAAVPASLSAAEDFYKGKQISIMAGGGGAYEAYARLLAKHMPKYIPGQPNIIVQNMSGTSGLKVTNYIYNNAPKDGTEIGAGQGHIPSLPLFNMQGVQYDPTKLGWVGNITKEVYIGYVWHTSPVLSMEQARQKESIMGGQSIGAMSIDIAILANVMMGTKFKIVTGYAASAETMLAVERGEIHGHLGTTWTNLKISHPDWLAEKKVKLIAQFGSKPAAELPDVPLMINYVIDPEDKKALELFLKRQETGKPFFVPPGVPADRLAILRKAFDSAVRDPAFLAEAEKGQLDVTEPMSGQEIETYVAAMNNTPAKYAKRINDIFASYIAPK